jgi:hypothetical protein
MIKNHRVHTISAHITQHKLIPDWDVLGEIYHIIYTQPLPYSPAFSHVLCHQDTKTAYDNLSLVAQLNMDADQAAKQLMNAYGATRPYGPCFPHNQAQLHLPEGTSTYRNQSQIQYAASIPELKAYSIQQRNNWYDSTMSPINWTAHGRAINRRIIPCSHCCKLIHDTILPTNSVVSQYNDNRRRLGSHPPLSPFRSKEMAHLLPHQPTEKMWNSQDSPLSPRYLDFRIGLLLVMAEAFRL